MFKSITQFGKNALVQKGLRAFGTHQQPARVAVTGAAGQIGYSLVFRIASGEMLGKNQPVIIHLVDIPQANDALRGVKMELQDCAFPNLVGIETHDNLSAGFKDIDYALLVGAKPRGPGMERADLLKDNGKIFVSTGKALNDNAKRTVKVIVVGNPANTNCLIAAHYAKDIPKENFTAMTRLDHNRGLTQIAEKTGSRVVDIRNFAVWGNHSPTMYPDLTYTTINGKNATNLVDKDWINNEFIPVVQQRGAAIIKARKLSSAASAANAAIDHIRDWVYGTNGEWTSMAIPSDGSYGIEKGLIFSYPVVCENGTYRIVQGLEVNEESRKRLNTTQEELLAERKAVEELL